MSRSFQNHCGNSTNTLWASAEGNPGMQASRERNQNAILQSLRGREADRTRTKRRPHLVARERAVPGVAAGAGVLRELLLAPASERHTEARVSTRRQLPPAPVDPDASRQQERRNRMWGGGEAHTRQMTLVSAKEAADGEDEDPAAARSETTTPLISECS